jgi:lipopolysaccharide biosynthesis protein
VRNARRRCILFAPYYPDKQVDEIDIMHLEQLKDFGDIYCYVNNDDFGEDQVSRLMPYVKEVLSGIHEELDFGSWKRLIQHLGWTKLETYDELVLINNSVIPVGNVTPLFLAASGSDAQFFAPLLVDENYNGPELLLADYMTQHNPFHASAMFVSFFWVIKDKLMREPFFRDFMLGVKKEEDRVAVCYAYERGFTRAILRHEVSWTCLVDRVFRFSCIYTADAFDLVEMGFPYVKRKLFDSTFYYIPNLEARTQGLLRRLPPDIAKVVERFLSKSRELKR